MRYIPELASDVIVQVPEDKNAYINVRNIGASGRGDLRFTGTVTDVQSGIVTISNITDGERGTLFQYRDILRSGVNLQVFSYDSPTTQDTPILSVASFEDVEVNFSSSTATNPNLAPLTYYVFGFDPVSGRLPFFRSVVNVGTKILNPDLWGTEQYVQLNFTLTNQSAVPVIYRSWGTRVEFLGVIGKNKIGYPGSGSFTFRDLGLSETPSWDTDPVLPEFMSDVFSVSGNEVAQVKRIVAKEIVEIVPNPFGSLPSYIQCTGLSAGSQILPGNTTLISIDDTQFVQEAINIAASSSIKEIFFPAGVYNISDSSFVNSPTSDFSNISLRGVGDGSVLKRLSCTQNNSENPGILNFTGQALSPRITGIRLRSMSFDGNRSESFSSVSPITSEVGVQISYADNIVINDCSVENCGGGGISLFNTEGASVTNNTIRLTGRAYEQTVSPLLIDISQKIVVQGNIMEFATSGPRVISTDYSTINGNIIRACGDSGLTLETSFQWNSQGNLAYSDNDSIIRSVDSYNNEYSRATIEVRKGIALDPIYMTVTLGGESVQILKNSVGADVFELDSSGTKVTPAIGSFKVLETASQLEAGIFSLTLPGQNSVIIESGRNAGNTAPATGTLSNPHGYMYEVKADVLVGQGGRGFQPLSIRTQDQYIAVRMRNPSDLLGFQIYSAGSLENDKIRISGYSNTDLEGWSQTSAYTVIGIDSDTDSLLLNAIPGFSPPITGIEFIGGSLFIQRSNYFVADGNLIVHSF